MLYWGSVLVSSRGVGLIAKLASDGTVIGTLIPGAILVVMGIVFLLQGNHSAAPMNAHHLLPAWTGLAGLVLIVNNFLAYSGMEMNAVHVDEMKEPGSEFPKSIFVAMVLVLAIFILPALVISWVVPSAQISLTAGVMQAFSAFFAHFSLNFLVPLIAIAMVVAMLSGMMAWLAGPSKGLLEDRPGTGLPAAPLPEGERRGHPDEHPRRPGHRDLDHRPALRVHPQRLERLLDLLGDDHPGVPDHVERNGGEFGDGKRRSVAGKDCVGAGKFIEDGENFEFYFHFFGDRFD